ncbi:MAG: hypothetical protein DCC67_09155 [Planctomycetota bacterium]|nr:MAG: hypothetical protein DCC67_09155 [Planctomycetota bacterium]
MEKLRGDLLEAALEFYAALAQQAGESESARAGRADALHRLGGAYWQLGRMAEAVKAYNGTLDVYRALERDYPDNAAYPYGAAKALSTLGEIRNEGYDAGAAAPLLAEGLQRFRRLHLASPGDVDLAARFAYLHSLEGERLRQLGQMSEAAEVFARGIEVLRSVKLESLDVAKSRDVRYQLSRALSQLARLQTHALWQFKPAREHYDEAIAIMRGVYQEAPELGDCAFTLAQILRNSGDLYGREFYLEQAKAAYEEGLAVLAALEQRHPDVPHYRQERAELHQSLGGLHAPFEPGNMTDDGLAHAEQAAAIGKQLVARFPEQVDRRVALARYQSSLAHLYLIRGRTDEAQAVYTEACDTLAAVGETTGKHVDVLYTLAEIQYTVADQLADSGRTDSALALLEQCEQNLNRLTSTAPQLGEAYLSLANLHITRSECFEASSRFVDAAAELDRVAAAGAKTQSMATAPWMRSTMQAILSLAKPLKWGYLKRAREGALLELAKSGQFDQLQRQCRRLAEVTGEASDHYIAAQTLAASAGIAAAAEGLEEPKRQETAESLAAAAVDELRLAWEAGYIRRTRGLGGLLRAQPTVKQMLEDEQLQRLAQRPDFQQLLERIRAENPPRRPTAPDAPAPSP